MRLLVCSLLIMTIAVPASTMTAYAQATQRTATTTVATPVFASSDSSQPPLRVAREGSVLLLIGIAGDWCHVEFEDPQYGRRSGYVQTQSVRIEPIAPRADVVPGDQHESGAPTRLSPPASASRQPTAQANVATRGDDTLGGGMLDGELLGSGTRTGTKVGVGVAIGVLSGLIGTGIGYFVIGPEPMSAEALQRYSTKSPEYQMGFKSGWDKKTESKKRHAFLVGGLLGTAGFVVLFLSAQNANQY